MNAFLKLSTAFFLLGFFSAPYAEPANDIFADPFENPEANPPKSTVLQVPVSKAEHTQAYDYRYRVGPRDLIEVEVFMVEELGDISRVNSEGYISLPLIGAINIMGLTVEEAERLIEKKLKEKYLQDPHVTVFVKEYESQKITINGWVKSPGVFPLKGKTTLLEAISMAKGLDRLADADEIVVFRNVHDKGTVGYIINFEQVQAGAIANPVNPVLQNNDIVVVPENGSKAAFEETTKTLRSFVGFLPFL
ncbi:MAG: polysaccharide export protein [Gammaproteobacteria bacterium]|nr:MAG: polysaccharide export protein [Gammaproteobacteria bacterium]